MKKIFTFLCAILTLASLQAQTLVASYPFNGNANDATGNAANNGTVNGATLTTDRFGNANSAYNFNGTNSYIQGSASNFPTGDRTISLWFNADAGTIANHPGLFGYGGGVCGTSFFEAINNVSTAGKYQTQGHCNTNSNQYAYPAAPENNWYNWVITVSGTTSKIYINGVLVSTAATFTTPTTVAGTNFIFGNIVNTNGIGSYGFEANNISYFTGKLDDVKIYNGALSDAQVADAYATGSLAASYPFNGNANDASGNGNNGTVVGATLTTDRFGNANSAYSFNGTTSNYITVTNSPSLQLGSQFTIATWIKLSAYNTNNYQSNVILSKGNDVADLGSFNTAIGEIDGNIGVDPNGYERFLFFNNPNGSAPYAVDGDIVAAPQIELNKWYYTVATVNGAVMKVYVNGALVQTKTFTSTLNANNTIGLFIGTQNLPPPSDYSWNGSLDDIKIYNSVLSDAQIFDTYVNDLKKPGSGNAIQLTGTGSLTTSPYINIGSGFDFGTQPFTYETWVKRDVIGTTLGNIGKSVFVGDNTGAWGIGILNDNTLFFTKVGINSINSTGTIADTKWHHVAVVYTGTQIQFYIDGVAAGSPSYTDNFSNTSGNYFIGPRQSVGNSNGDQTLDGRLDETRIWRNVALTQTQIRDWMCKKVTSAHPAYANMFAYYHFEEGSGTAAYSVGGHAGTLMNSPTWVTSGASLGDASAYDYTNATKTVTLAALTGETFTATSTSGNPAGIQMYRVDTIPNTTTGANSGLNDKYFGVFQAGGTLPQYTAVYNYNGNPLVNAGNENSLRLFKRADNSATTWTMLSQAPNTTAKTITVTGESTEYILGSSGNPLPVTLIEFGGIKSGSAAKLFWTTANEIGFDHFEIEKSTDGRTYTALQILAAKGSQQNSYAITDASPVRGKNFYRLKMVDKGGSFSYSSVVVIDFSAKNSFTLYPNPATAEIHIYSNAVISKVLVLDISGRLVKTYQPAANNSYNIQELKSGIYFIKVISAGATNITKLEKL